MARRPRRRRRLTPEQLVTKLAGSARRPALPHWEAGKGACRWCGESVLGANGLPNPRALWHAPCVVLYKLATSSAEQRRQVWARDKGVCAECGTRHPRNGNWAADHMIALGLLDRTEPDFLFYFSMDNLQTLCNQPCHADKTRDDHQKIAVLRRALKNTLAPTALAA